MKKFVASTTLAASVLAGGAAAIVVAPGIASAQDDPSDEVQAPSWVEEALQTLVDNGTLTEAQADQVATTLQDARPERGPRGHHRGARSEVLADVLGIEQDELREALRSGQSIADVAEANGVDVQVVIDALVAEANTKIDQAVADGRIDEAEADAKRADLEQRITDRVNGEFERRGPGPDAGEGEPA